MSSKIDIQPGFTTLPEMPAARPDKKKKKKLFLKFKKKI